MSTLQNTLCNVCAFGTLLLFSSYAVANNVSVTNTLVVGQNNTQHYIFVQFDISWENSFRDNINDDAVWVFVKYRTAGNTWAHATLNTTGHTVPAGFSITTSADGKGVFIHRSTDTSGTSSLTGVQLRWNYGADAVADNQSKVVRVYAIEMIYVPGGVSFSVGDGTSANSFKDGSTTNPFLISSQTSLALGSASGNLNWTTGGNSGTPSGSTDPNFPTGYNAFYCMKYEITQEQYVVFLNALTFNQQATRTGVSPDTTSGTKAFSGILQRNGMEVKTPGTNNSIPAVYGCDLTDDGIYDAPNDGQNVPCNMSWGDGTAYADWAGLRPMTELEYEKACRGDLPVIPGEFAWGTATIASVQYLLSNAGSSAEGVVTNYSITNGNCAYFSTAGGIGGPLRVGIFAANTANNNRVSAGATYYGIMEMSGNLNERVVSVGTATSRAFTGLDGDGTLDASGNANVVRWPGTTGTGCGYRGGNFSFFADQPHVSDRSLAAVTVSIRPSHTGFRCVRTAP